jgi:flagellar motor switch protein FliG
MTESSLAHLGTRKVAALLISLGTEAAAKLLARLPPDAIDKVALEVMRMPTLDPSVRDSILEETYAGLLADGGVLPGGENYAEELLTEAFGEGRAREMIDRAVLSQRVVPFEFLLGGDPVQIAELLATEHPQTIALVLAHVPPRLAATILVGFEATLQVDVARRIALTDQTTPEALEIVEDGLRRRMSSVRTETPVVGGARPLAHVLNQVDRTTEKQILGALSELDADLADEVRRFMFVFEDVIMLDDRSMQRVIRELDQKDMALALRSVPNAIRDKFFANMSQRAADTLREEMSLSAQVRIKHVEEAQGRIVGVIRTLEDGDEIVINRGGGEDDALV